MCNHSTIFLYCRTCLHKYKHTYRETHVNSIWAIFCIRNVSCLYCIRIEWICHYCHVRERKWLQKFGWTEIEKKEEAWKRNESLANDKRFYLLYQMTKHINWLQLVLYALHISNQTVCFFLFFSQILETSSSDHFYCPFVRAYCCVRWADIDNIAV